MALLNLPLLAFLSKEWVSVLGSTFQWFLSRLSQGDNGHNLLRKWFSAEKWLSWTNHRYVLHDRTIRLRGCRVPFPDRQAASSPGELASWLGPWWWYRTSSGSELGRCVAGMQIRYCWGPDFNCMEHGAPDARMVNSSSGMSSFAPSEMAYIQIRWTHGIIIWKLSSSTKDVRCNLSTKECV